MSGRSLSAGVLFAIVAASLSPSAAPATPGCDQDGSGWCLSRRIAGDAPEGELGFRFGEPLDLDGDGRADVAAGARFKAVESYQNGTAAVWSGATGARLREWNGEISDALFGHWVMPVPDLSGDEVADLIITAPNAAIDGTIRGQLVARSLLTDKDVWRRSSERNENLGWDLSLADDSDGDGRVDVFAGAPSANGGRVHLISGRDGATLRIYAPREQVTTFGWFVAQVDDLDGDGRADVAVGAPWNAASSTDFVGGAYVFSAAMGSELRHWKGSDAFSTFGEVVAAVGDLDGDGRGEIAVAAPRTNDQTRSQPGDVFVYSGATGRELRHWSGKQPGEIFGRMVLSAGDLDGDGIDDLAIGAPWFRSGEDTRVGRVEFRSGRSGDVIGELVGDARDGWFGWHIRRAPDPDCQGRPTLLISSIRHPVDGRSGVGVLDLYVLKPVVSRESPARMPDGPVTPSQGTTSLGARRSDIR